MSKLYKYLKAIDQYTTYTLITPENDFEAESVSVELGTIDGETYVLIPENTTLPEDQPEQIAESVAYIGDGYDKESLISSFNLTRNQTETKSRELCLAALRAEAKNQIEVVSGYPQWFQNNVANCLYSSEIGDAMKDYIALVIIESNRCEDIITTGALLEALAVVPTWPEV